MSAEFFRLFAYEFETDLSLAEMLPRLGAITSWHWLNRDSDRWGHYLSAAARPRTMGDYNPPCESMLKILDLEKGKFALNIRYKSILPNADEDFENLHREICERVLPALNARNIERAEDYE